MENSSLSNTAPTGGSNIPPTTTTITPSTSTSNGNKAPNATRKNYKPRKNSTKKNGNTKEKQNQQLNPTAVSWEPKQKVEDEICILCASPLNFVAIGNCNHPVCSVCSMRLRLRSQDKNCAICKTMLNTIVICPFRNLRNYESFGFDDDSTTTGVDVELRSRSFFVNCKDHLKEINKLISLQCPSCKGNFQSEKVLFKHVKTAHSQHFCELCFTHRSLFPCEQKLMTSAELTEHINSPPGSMIGSGGDKSGGHPLCRFCSQRYFDSQALYLHMRDVHFTCHLCPSRYQQRFYRGIPQLLNHLHHSHFVCQVCLPTTSSDSSSLHYSHQYGSLLHSSFARKEEYSDHMRSTHGIISSPTGTTNALSLALAASFPISGSRGASTTSAMSPAIDETSNVEYLDLNMSSADPYRLDSHSNQSLTLENFDSSAPLVPPHMRILGRVTGGGTFLSDHLLEAEEARLEEVRNGGRNPRIRKEKSKQNQRMTLPSQLQSLSAPRSHQANDFPALTSVASSVAPGTGGTTYSSHPHPLSVVPSLLEKEKLQKAKTIEEEQTRLQEREIAVRRVQRNMALADALGLDTMAIADAVKMIPSLGSTDQKSSSDYELDSGLIQYLMANSFLSHLKMCVEYMNSTSCVKSATRVDLRRPIYHPDMLVWAKTYRTDLLKTEKRIFELLADRSTSSLQLKPMKKWSRDTMILLANYYLLGAQEYSTFNKDDMYVSFVKTVESCLPATLLSAAADPPSGTGLSSTELQALLVEEIRSTIERQDFRPQILFTIRRSGAGATVGEFLCELKGVFDSNSINEVNSDQYVTELSCLGYSHLRLSFSSLSAASHCHRLIKNSSSSSLNLNQKYHIDPYFVDELIFPLQEESPHEGGVETESSKEFHWRSSDGSQPSSSSAPPAPSTIPSAAPPPPDKWDLAFQAARSRPHPVITAPPPLPPKSSPPPAVDVVMKKTKKVKKIDNSSVQIKPPPNSFSLLDSDSDSES